MRKDLLKQFMARLDEMRLSKMLDRRDVYANLQEILIPYLSPPVERTMNRISSTDDCVEPSGIFNKEYKNDRILNYYVFLFLFQGKNFEKNEQKRSNIKSMMEGFSKFSKANNLQILFEKKSVNFMLLSPKPTGLVQDKLMNIIKASQKYSILFYDLFIKKKSYSSQISKILESFIH